MVHERLASNRSTWCQPTGRRTEVWKLAEVITQSCAASSISFRTPIGKFHNFPPTTRTTFVCFQGNLCRRLEKLSEDRYEHQMGRRVGSTLHPDHQSQAHRILPISALQFVPHGVSNGRRVLPDCEKHETAGVRRNGRHSVVQDGGPESLHPEGRNRGARQDGSQHLRSSFRPRHLRQRTGPQTSRRASDNGSPSIHHLQPPGRRSHRRSRCQHSNQKASSQQPGKVPVGQESGDASACWKAEQDPQAAQVLHGIFLQGHRKRLQKSFAQNSQRTRCEVIRLTQNNLTTFWNLKLGNLRSSLATIDLHNFLAMKFLFCFS